MKKNVTVLILIFLILSCRDKSITTKNGIRPDVTTLGCDDYFAEVSDMGVFVNNVWNKKAANDFDWNQCIEKQIVNDSVQYGWSWKWPSDGVSWLARTTSKEVIYAYPQVKVGRSPWDPLPFVDHRFPLSINTTQNLTLSYEVETVTNGQHNLATTMWLVNSPKKIVAPDPSSIVAEFMVWTYATENHFKPAGTKYGEIKLEDIEWEVWVHKNWRDPSGIQSNKWICLSFRSKTNRLKAEFDLLALVKYSIREGLISKDLYVADVELGNEIMNGSGNTLVKSFKIK